jgi:hypothetical protein
MNSNLPMLKVDFNEMLGSDLVLLSAGDVKTNLSGEPVSFHDGLAITVFMEDADERGNVDNLIAKGVVVRNLSDVGWAANAKWCCRIDEQGIRHESEL